ncbi:MAG TPA: hypothetical protein VF516_36745 [Kofleriaceae bacterium]
MTPRAGGPSNLAELEVLAGHRARSLTMKHLLAYMLVVGVGCGTGVHSNPGVPPDGPPVMVPDGPLPDAPLETQRLGMNDISIVASTIFPDVSRRITGIGHTRDVVPRALYARLATSHGDIIDDFDKFMVFGIRFDLCDRLVTGPCPEGVDGSLRLVFQPLGFPISATDVGLHAFYTIPAAELGYVINELRAVARLEGTGPMIDGGLTGLHNLSTEGEMRLDALLDRYAIADRLIRLDLMGQDARSSVPHVVFRGIELHDGQWNDIPVADVDATQQDAALTGSDPSYDVTPVADRPQNLALTLTSDAFNAAAPAAQRDALDALVATQNPQLHTSSGGSSTVQCVACHVATYLAVHRAQVAAIALDSLPSRFQTTHDARITDGISTTTPGSLHNFGWLGPNVAISQRAANETAMVLDEIQQRFPVP